MVFIETGSLSEDGIQQFCQASWATRFRELPFPTTPVTELQAYAPMSGVFHLCAGDLTKVPMLAQQALDSLIHCLSPSFF